MIQRGSFLIDELSGKVYRVTDREIDPLNPDRALLTLDQEITFVELDADGSGGPTLDPGEALRTVWVYPPPVERVGGVVTFTGPQPVVGIDVRRMTFSP